MWIGEQSCMPLNFGQFSRNNIYVSISGKLSEIHLHAWLFSNPCGKVLIIVGISWSPDLRVQHTVFYTAFYTVLFIVLFTPNIKHQILKWLADLTQSAKKTFLPVVSTFFAETFTENWIVQSSLYCTVNINVNCTVNLALIRGKSGWHILFRKYKLPAFNSIQHLIFLYTVI